MSKIEVDTIDTQSSTTLQVGSTNTSLIKIGTSGDTVEYPAGTTFTQSGTQNVTSGGAINVKSGGSIIIESGAAITNNGTATGFSADLTNLNATNLTSGTVPDARFPATLPIASGSALTNLNATNLASGTVPDARFPATLPAISGANLTNLPASGITGADQWRLTSGFTGGVNPIASNLERNDTYFSKIGTGLSQASGIFTFPDTGIWQITFNYNARNNGDDRVVTGYIAATTDNSSYANIAYGDGFIQQTGGSTTYISSGSSAIFDVTNTTTHKVRFQIAMVNPATLIIGDSATNTTYFTFIRLGDT
jgi:hypothetical protein